MRPAPAPSTGGPGSPARRRARVIAGVRAAAAARGTEAFRAVVRRSGDRRLERTAGSHPGLRLLFAAMARRFVPSAAGGFTGDLLIELRGSDGRVRAWTVTIAPDRAIARPGRPPAPALTVRLGVADVVRLAAGDLDPGSALLSGRMDLEGEFALASRLGEMFGRGRL